MPPVVATTACAERENSPASARSLAWPRFTELGARIAPDTPATALGPARVGQPAHALRVQPRALLARAEADVGLRPAPRPLVLRAVEAGRAEPVLERQLVGVLHAHAPLLGAVDEHQPAERPERLAAEGALGLLVEQEHAPAGVGQLRRRHQAGEPGADDDDVPVHPQVGSTDPRGSPGGFSSTRRISASAARPTSSWRWSGSRVPTTRWISKPGRRMARAVRDSLLRS